MLKANFRRIALTLAVLTVLVSVFCLTAMAANVSYDFASYGKTADVPKYDATTPENGGWEVVKPAGLTKGTYNLVFAESSTGFEDSATRFGTVHSDGKIIYHIPEADQVNIKDFGGIVFNRRLSNGHNLADSYGAMIGILLTMDDGQTIYREYNWYKTNTSSDIIGTGKDETDVSIASAIEALEGNPKLASIAYIPYVDGTKFNLQTTAMYQPAVADDPATPDVDETKAAVAGSYYYFLTTHFDLIEVAEAPAGLEGVKDNYDGVDVTAHDGKITGLNAEKTYKYAPVYSLEADFVEVSGATEITALEGGVYEVRGVEDGKYDSSSVIVVVPKTAKGGLNFEYGMWDTDGANADIPDVYTVKSRVPVYGAWTAATSKPYPASPEKLDALAGSYPVKHISGLNYVPASFSSVEFYRENVLGFTYALTLEEQFDVDELAVEAMFRHYVDPVTNLAAGAEAAIKIYTNGDNSNPVVVKTPYTSNGMLNAFAEASEKLDGYVTRIDFMNFYTLPNDQKYLNETGYMMLQYAKTYAPVKLEAPTGFTVDVDNDGKAMIKGFDSALTYAYSTDNDVWTMVTGVTEVSGLEFTTYYIKQLATRPGDTDSDATTVTINGAIEFTGAPYVDGNAIKGLDADTLYEYTKYDFFGAQGWADVPAGATEITDLDNALYAIRVKKSENYLASASKYLLIGNDSAKQSAIINVNPDTGVKTLTIDKTAANVKGAWTSTNHRSLSGTYDNTVNYTAFLINSFGKLAGVNADAYAQLMKVDVNYTMTDEQIVPLSKLYSIKVGFKFRGNIADSVFENVSVANNPYRVRVHVVGGKQPYYDVDGKGWGSSGIVNYLNTFNDDDAYVVALQFFFMPYIPEGAAVQDQYKPDGVTVWPARDLYPVLYVHDYALKGVAPTPTLAAEGTANGYKITGLDSAYTYAYSTDKEEWITLPAGVVSFIVNEGGTYYVKAINSDQFMEGGVAEITIAGTRPAVTGLTLEGNTIKGLDANATYEYAVINAFAPEWTTVTNATEIADLDAGVWAVRLAGGDGYFAGAAQCLLIKGENYGSIAWGTTDRSETGFVQGKWTSGNKTVYNSAFTYGDLKALRLGIHWSPVYADRLNYYYLYTMANDEVIPVQNLCAKTYLVGFGVSGTCLGTSPVTMKIRVYVAQSDVEYYDYDVEYVPTQWNSINFNPAQFLPEDAKGYVTAIKFIPVYDAVYPDGFVATNQYPVLGVVPYMIEGKDDLAQDSAEKWRVVIEANPGPKGFEVALEDETSYVKGYKITGFDPAKAYEYSIDGEVWTTLEAGATELDAFAARYYIRYAATATEKASDSTAVDVPMINPVFGDRNATQYKDWINTPSGWSTAELHLTTYMGPTTKLNTAYYKYNFREADLVKVDEHPYFSIDFNAQTIGMNIPSNVIPNAELYVDIYVQGTDTVYTVKAPWRNYATVNGYTNNKIMVNLLEEFPELAGKTITGFKIRPYANLENDLTPASYNAGGYIYFRLFYVGFFDTPNNTDALVLNKNSNFARVNALDGLYAEANKILAVGATLTKDDLDVYEVYTDGQKNKVENFEFVAPENFASESGTYTVTVNGRLGTTTTADVNIGLASIVIKNAPTKTEYFDGDAVDLEGIELVAVLENGDEIAIDKGYYATVETVALDMTAITVTYGGCEASYDITVKAVELESIAINTWPDKEVAGGYMEGDPVDLTGLTIKATYNNGKTEILGLDKIEAVYGAEVMTRGTKLTISYGGKTLAGFVLTVNSKAISDVVISTPASTLVYMAGDELDTTGLELTVNYEDGTSEIVTEGFIADADLSEAGEVTVSVLYEGFTLEYTVTVRIIESAFIMTPPTKLEYVVGEELDTEGLELYVLYSDGEEEYLTEGFELIYDAFTEAGEYEIVLKYYDYEEPFVVTVVAAEEPVVLESITVTAPTKTEYTVGDTLDLEGMTVTANYSDGTTADVTAKATVDADVFEIDGIVTVTVSFEDKTATFDVTVNPVPVVLESITVTAPTKTEYTVGDALDLEGMTVTANYSDGSTADVTAKATVDVTVLETAGNVTVTVSFADKTATFTVTVAEKVVEPEEPENIAEGTIGTINWVVSADGVLTVSGEGAIPAYTKNANAPWTAYAKQITKIVVADGVTEIGNYAFYKLASATSIEVADSVEKVGQLFLRDSGITEISLPGVKTVALNAFGSTTKLTTVIFSDKAVDFKGNIFNAQTITVKAPANSYADKYVELYGDRYSGNVTFESDGTTASNPVVRFAFAGDSAFFAIFENAKGNWSLEISGQGKMKNFPYVCEKNIKAGFTFSPMYYIGDLEEQIDGKEPEAKILSIKVADGITTIGNYIFHKCTKASSLTLPEGITSIGQGAFRLCQRLTKITLPEAVTKIEKTAFVSCGALTEIYIPEGVVEVGTGIFDKCTTANITVKTKSETAISVISAEYPEVTIVTEF